MTDRAVDVMSLRDYFAAKAMQAIVINTRENLEITYDDVAREAYMQADAMLEARQVDWRFKR